MLVPRKFISRLALLLLGIDDTYFFAYNYNILIEIFCRYPNVYGIDMPTRQELVAYNRNEDSVAKEIGADVIIYQVKNNHE